MIKSKLNQEQEREITLAHLCGARPDTLQELYGIPRSTITANIVGKRSHEWDDELVEFYRESYPKNKDRNFAHMFLTFNTDKDYKVLPKELIVHPKDSSVAEVVEDTIYKPGIEEVSNRTALREYIDRQTSYDNLVSSVFGLLPKEHAEYMSRKIFIDLLKRDYSPDKDIFLKNIFDETGNIIIDNVREGGLAWTNSKKNLVNEVLNTLNERERDILGMRFGLDGYEGPKTLREIGKVFGVTGSRIMQNEAKALRKLKHPSKSKNLMFLCGLATDEDVKSHMDKIHFQEERLRWRKELYSEIAAEVKGEIIPKSSTDNFLNTPISDLELSIRSAVCLKNDGIEYVGDLVQKSEAEMLRTPNFGRKSLNELKKILSPHRLHFGMEVDFKRTEEN